MLKTLGVIFGMLTFTWLFSFIDLPSPAEQIREIRSSLHSGLYKLYLVICLLLTLLVQMAFILIWIAAIAILITKLWR